jgi:hypothetical protein
MGEWDTMGRTWLYRDTHRRCFYNWRTGVFSRRACLSGGADGLVDHGLDLDRPTIRARCRLRDGQHTRVVAFDGPWRLVEDLRGFADSVTAYNCDSGRRVALPDVAPGRGLSVAHSIATYITSRFEFGARTVEINALDLSHARRFTWSVHLPQLSCDSSDERVTVESLDHAVFIGYLARTAGTSPFCSVRAWRAEVARLP